MKYATWLLALGLACATAASAATVEVAVAAEEAKAEETTVVGTVVVQTAEDGSVASVAIQDEAGQLVPVVLDEKGKELAGMKGQKVKAVGEMTEQGLKVKKCKAVEPAAG